MRLLMIAKRLYRLAFKFAVLSFVVAIVLIVLGTKMTTNVKNVFSAIVAMLMFSVFVNYGLIKKFEEQILNIGWLGSCASIILALQALIIIAADGLLLLIMFSSYLNS